MAVLDEYIQLMIGRKAAALIFASGAVPEILVGGVRQAVGPRAATWEEIVALASGVLGSGFEQALAGGQTRFSYSGPLGSVSMEVRGAGHERSLEVRTFESRQPQEASPDPGSAPPSSRPATTRLDPLFEQMRHLGASDLHLKSGKAPMVRIDGSIQSLPDHGILSAGDVSQLVRQIMPAMNIAEYDATNDTDFTYESEHARIRCNVFHEIAGIGAVFRLIPTRIPTVRDLGLPPAVIELLSLRKGLILVTGPTGSGKTTTLAAMINWINENRRQHIITIEDPVEFVHEDKQCRITHRGVGIDTRSFKVALRAALREDPDVVLIGEMRDLETAAIAIETAETGHLVFATLHTNTAASTVERLVDQFPAERQGQIRSMVSESLKGIVAQTLLKKIGGGRVAALEILLGTTAVANLIREGKTFQLPNVMQVSARDGMQTMNDGLLALVKGSVVEPGEAWSNAVNRKDMALLLTRNGFKGAWSDA